MLKRTISGAVLIVIITLVLAFSNVPFVLNIFVAMISAAALYEAMIVTGYVESKFLIFISLSFAILVPFFHILPRFVDSVVTFCFFIFTVIIFASLMLYYQKFSFERLCVIFLLSLMIPLFFTTLVYIRKLPFGLYGVIFVFCASWMTDTGGYIFGKLFGRHKFTPKISPKKTIEGAIGGILSALTACICLCYIVDVIDSSVDVNYFVCGICAVIGSAFAIFGDLSASLIKRNFNVKDFGHIIPGHGGIMDRFDSVLFVAPSLYLLFQIMPVFSKVTF